MTKEETKRRIEVMQAWVDGKAIQGRLRGLEECWCEAEPQWSWDYYDFRIKPEPLEIEAWVSNSTGKILDTSIAVSPQGYTKKKFREVND